MNIKDLIKSKEERKNEIVSLIDTCDDVAQLKAYNTEMRSLNDELGTLKEALSAMDTQSQNGVSARTKAVNGAEGGLQGENGTEPPVFVKTENNIMQKRQNTPTDDDPTNSIEYREAFKTFVGSGVKTPELRADAVTMTADAEAVIPTILSEQIIDDIIDSGMILSRVTRTNYPAGVDIAANVTRPVATWVAEGTGSDKQKLTADKISFKEHKLRCEVVETIEVETMSLKAFEALFIQRVVEAMTVAIETKICSDDAGTSSCAGIFNGIKAAQTLTISTMNYAKLLEIEGMLKSKYDSSAVWLMAKKTFYNQMLCMVDDNGQPIARVNIGLDGKPTHTLLGRDVIFTAEYLPSFDAATTGKIYAGIVDLKDYMLNNIYDLGVMRMRDWDTENMKTKAVANFDGKMLMQDSVIALKKGTTTP